MSSLRNAVLVSLVAHAILLIGLSLYKIARDAGLDEILIESVIATERPKQDFRREMEQETAVATTLNFTAGGKISNLANPSVSGAGVQRELKSAVEESSLLEKPKIDIKVNPLAPPRNAGITNAVSDSAVKGETGAIVEGYGAALGQLTRELIGIMRNDRVLVVWMLDESHSMKDDREDIAGNVDKVFDELGVAAKSDVRLRRGKEILTQAVVTYGRNWTDRLAPTADIDKVREAIKVTDESQIDKTGDENMCTAIEYVCTKYGKTARVQKRKCLVIVVSDESGDDGQRVEHALVAAKQFDTRIYVLGRESAFGHRTSLMRVEDPDPQFKGLVHQLPIRRGPETAYVECLQWNGLRERRDNYRAYFGPYEMARLAKETGGVFFLLPGEEEDLSGPGARDRRKFQFLDMKQYEPALASRREYEAGVADSDFRKGIFRVILALDPDHEVNTLIPGNPKKPNGVLHVYRWSYPMEVTEFRAAALADVKKAVYSMRTLDLALAHLRDLEPLRAFEESPRWRANYDLAVAQCMNYKVRLFQSLLAMDEHANAMPKPRNERSNRWHFHRSRRVIRPDEDQFTRLKEAFALEMERQEFLDEMQGWIDTARGRYESVIADHSGTPWAQRAEAELSWGFGMAFREHFHDPRFERAARTRTTPLPKL